MIRRLSRESATYARLRTARNVLVHRIRRLGGVHSTAYVHHTAVVHRDLVAAEYAFVGPRCRLDPRVSIGRYTMLASYAAVVGADHVHDIAGVPMQFSGRPDQPETVIGSDVWIGYNALVMRGVTIGDGAIVAAHAVVTSDVLPFEIVAGIPARQIGFRLADELARETHLTAIHGPLLRPAYAIPLALREARP